MCFPYRVESCARTHKMSMDIKIFTGIINPVIIIESIGDRKYISQVLRNRSFAF